MPTDPMSIEAAAEYLNASDITVKRFIREKLIPAQNQNGTVMLERLDVERYKKISEQFSR